MDSSHSLFGIIVPSRGMGLFRLSTSEEESEMNLTTITVNLAKRLIRNGSRCRAGALRCAGLVDLETIPAVLKPSLISIVHHARNLP